MTLKVLIKSQIGKLFHKLGYNIIPIMNREELSDISEDDLSLITSVKQYTLTSTERMYALIEAVRYIVNNKISGDIVECGVWKGGSMMLIAKTLVKLKNTEYDLYLFDTFEGTTKPTEFDLDYQGRSMLEIWKKDFEEKKKISSFSDPIPLEEVKNNIFSTGYPKEKIHFIKGKVEDTIPENTPEKISILRLDTDWYESTKYELNNLFPKLCSYGILIIDDYGHFKGSRKAVDEYFSQNKIKCFLNRIDYTGRLIIKI